MYQLPYRISIAGSLVAREGFRPALLRDGGSIDPSLPEKRVLLVIPTTTACPEVPLDLRAEKTLGFRAANLTLTLDMFNC